MNGRILTYIPFHDLSIYSENLFPESSRLLLESIYYSVDPERVFTMPPPFFDFFAAVNEGQSMEMKVGEPLTERGATN